MEPTLAAWLRRFTSPADLYASLPQLYAKLDLQNVQGKVEQGAVVTGPVHIGEGSVIEPYAVIRGPSIIGSNVTVGSHSEIRSGSFIGSNCVIGHACSIIASMLMNSARVRAGAVLSNSIVGFGSIVGPNAVLGSPDNGVSSLGQPTALCMGAVLGDHATVCANCVLEPGTIIGPRSILNAGLIVSGIYGPDLLISVAPRLVSTRRER